MKPLIIIPVYNEAPTVAAVLEETQRQYRGDILVVDDGSTDGSREIVERFQSERIWLVTHPNNGGYGMTLRDGFAWALERQYDPIVTMDCDAQHEPAFISKFLAEIESVDVVSGSRYLSASQANGAVPADRRSINERVTQCLTALTGYALTDAFCGFKAYRRSVIAALSITETGYAMPLQVWIQMAAARVAVKEIPVSRVYFHLDRQFGGILDNPVSREQYYDDVLKKEAQRWLM